MITLFAAGCTAPNQSTRLTIGDMNHAVAEVQAKLAASDWLRERDAGSPPMRISINKVENLTSDVIPPSEQWLYMARLRTGLVQSATVREKNITFLIEPERRPDLRRWGYEGDMGPTVEPTHVMKGVFRSATRAAADTRGMTDIRGDYYLMEFTITGLDDSTFAWSDFVEFKREARGLVID